MEKVEDLSIELTFTNVENTEQVESVLGSLDIEPISCRPDQALSWSLVLPEMINGEEVLY